MLKIILAAAVAVSFASLDVADAAQKEEAEGTRDGAGQLCGTGQLVPVLCADARAALGGDRASASPTKVTDVIGLVGRAEAASSPTARATRSRG